MPVVGAAGLTLLSASPASALAGLAITPGSGTTSVEPVSITIPAACPTGTTSFLVGINGGGFTNGNAIGLTDYAEGETSFPAGGNWGAIAGNNPGTATPLNGISTLTFRCLQGSTTVAQYNGQVSFTGATNAFEAVPTPLFVEQEDFGPAGGTLETEPDADRKVNTSITVPGAGYVAINDGTPPAGNNGIPASVSVLPYQVDLTAPDATDANDPIVLEFEVLNSLLTGGAVPTVYRNAVKVPTCTEADGLPVAPVPACVVSAVPGAASVAFTVHTMATSVWNFGYPPAAAEGTPPSSGGSEQNLSVLIDPDTDCTDFVWSIIGSDTNVRMSDAVNQGTFVQSTGSLRPITVTDCREDQPAWQVTGQVGDFVNVEDTSLDAADQRVIPGRYLGWLPQLISPGAGGGLGLAVLPAVLSEGGEFGTGLSDARTMVSAIDGHAANPNTGQFGAAIELRVPNSVLFADFDPASPTLTNDDDMFGLYSTTLTLTAIST